MLKWRAIPGAFPGDSFSNVGAGRERRTLDLRSDSITLTGWPRLRGSKYLDPKSVTCFPGPKPLPWFHPLKVGLRGEYFVIGLQQHKAAK
jgi:hypothetical protein